MKNNETYTKEEILKSGIIIHTETQEQWDKIIKLFDIKWINCSTNWDIYKSESGINPVDELFAGMSFYKEHNYTIIDFNQVNFNEMKKIIGYKVPQDLFNGELKKGEIVVLRGTIYWQENSKNYLPKEIVETWEPVYSKEDHKIYRLSTNKDYHISIYSNGEISTINGAFTVQELAETFSKYTKLGGFKDWVVNVEEFKVHLHCKGHDDCGVRVTLEDLRNIMNIYKELQS